MPLVIGLDLSTVSTGVVVGDPAMLKASHCMTIKARGRSVRERIWHMAMEVKAEVANASCVHQKTPIVVIEELGSIRNGKTTKVLSQLHGAVYAALKFTSCEDIGWVHQSTAKAHIGAVGGKEAVLKRVKALGFRPGNSDEADAFAVWLAWKSRKP